MERFGASKGEGRLVRIFVGESDRADGLPVYEAIVRKAREMGIAGATVLRGVMGFGANSRVHSAKLLVLSSDLPMVVEIVDTQEHVDALLAAVEPMLGDCLVTIDRVEVLKYQGGRGAGKGKGA